MPYNHSKVEFWYLELQQFFSTFGGQTVVISLITCYANGYVFDPCGLWDM